MLEHILECLSLIPSSAKQEIIKKKEPQCPLPPFKGKVEWINKMWDLHMAERVVARADGKGIQGFRADGI